LMTFCFAAILSIDSLFNIYNRHRLISDVKSGYTISYPRIKIHCQSPNDTIKAKVLAKTISPWTDNMKSTTHVLLYKSQKDMPMQDIFDCWINSPSQFVYNPTVDLVFMDGQNSSSVLAPIQIHEMAHRYYEHKLSRSGRALVKEAYDEIIMALGDKEIAKILTHEGRWPSEWDLNREQILYLLSHPMLCLIKDEYYVALAGGGHPHSNPNELFASVSAILHSSPVRFCTKLYAYEKEDYIRAQALKSAIGKIVLAYEGNAPFEPWLVAKFNINQR
jgi:hypothetical protein